MAVSPAIALAGRYTVVMHNGARMEVSRAIRDGDRYRLELREGGSVFIPANAVKRVSNHAADLPVKTYKFFHYFKFISNIYFLKCLKT